MQRLIMKYAAYDISKLISDEEAFCNYINNHLSYISNEDFNKCISKKHEFITLAFLSLSNKAFDKLASAAARWLLKNDKPVYNKILNTYKIPANNFLKIFTQLKSDIISYIRRSVSNSKSIYKGINSYINNMFHTTDDESTEKVISNITDLKEYVHDKRNIDFDDLLEDIIRKAPLNFICYTDEQIEAICHGINKSFVKHYPNGIISRDDLSQFLQERAMSIESFYFRYFNENDLPIIKELIRDIHEYDNNVKIDYNKRLDEDLRIYISKFSYLIHEIFINNSKEILDNESFLDQIGVKQIIDNKSAEHNYSKNKQINKYINNTAKDKIKEYSSKEIKTNQKEEIKPVDKSQINFKSKQNNNGNSLRNMSFQQVKKLPTLPSLSRKNDNVGDKENISLAHYYQTKIIISSDGNIKYLPPNNNNQYINELANKNLNYAIGTITDNGIVCIHQNNNMNINDIINICKNDSQINKIYELNEQVNLAATITRRAKLAKLIWKK